MARIKDIVETEMQRSDMAACRFIHLFAFQRIWNLCLFNALC